MAPADGRKCIVKVCLDSTAVLEKTDESQS